MREGLLQLCGKVKEVVLDVLETGALRKVTAEYVVTKAHFYGERGLSLGVDRERREVWDSRLLHEIVQEAKTRSSAEFEDCALSVSRSTTEDLPTVRGYLQGLLATVARTVADLGEKAELDRLVDQFTHEISGGSIPWRGRIWLANVTVKDHALPIDDRLKLRPPRSDDFETEMPAELALARSPYDGVTGQPDAVLEFADTLPERPSDQVRRFVTCLCLFRVGSCSILKEEFSADSLLSGRSLESRPLPKLRGRFKYTLTHSDLQPLKFFADRLAAVIPPDPTGHHSDKGWVALKFYFRALFDASDWEECIALAVACIDGIFSHQKHDLVRQVTQRAAALLRIAGLSGWEVYRDIKDAFGIRNQYNHGSQVDRKRLQQLPALAGRLLEYTRLVVLKDMELHLLEAPESTGRRRKAKSAASMRQELGERLDASLLDDRVLVELTAELGGGLWQFAGYAKAE